MRLSAMVVICALAAAFAALPARAQSPVPLSPVRQTTADGYLPVNGDMECPARAAQEGFNGTVPDRWHGVLINTATSPNVESSLFAFGGMNCANSSSGIEKLQGTDSWTFKAPDMEETSQPGKPFDVAMYQQVPVTPGTTYTLSGWMVSLCGGSASPNDCPPGYYIAKMLGLDPTGGTNPLAPSVQWVENRMPHVDAYGQKIGWQNLQVAAAASAATMTVFVRVNSPFQHHGNHVFVDAVRLVAAPLAAFSSLPGVVYGQNQFRMGWNGSMGPEIPGLGGTYNLVYDLQYRMDASSTWQDWLASQAAGSAVFNVPAPNRNAYYYFRVRARAEQPDGAHGLWPHLPGAWTEAGPVHVVPGAPGMPRTFLPLNWR